jgi:uncharacterized protein YjdB
MKSPAPRLAVAALLAMALACSGDDKPDDRPSDVAVAGVEVRPASLTVAAGGTADLAAVVEPPSATNKAVTWDSSNKAVATVIGTGLSVQVSGVAAGYAAITVTTTDGGKTAACAVQVTGPGGDVAVTGVTLQPTSLTIAAGADQALAAAIEPPSATNKAVTWDSSNKAVATVIGTGPSVQVRGVAPGSSTITVTTVDGGKKAECPVHVTGGGGAVTGVRLSPKPITVGVGAAADLAATIEPAGAANQAVAWDTSNPAAVTVIGAGLSVQVRGVAPGSSTITVRTDDGGKTDTCFVSVVVPVSGVTLAPGSVYMHVDGPARALTATVAPVNATNPALTWASSNTAAATVAGSGRFATVTAVGAGEATITAASIEDPTKSAACAVTVAPRVTVASLRLPPTLTMESAGKTARLAAEVWPWDASSRLVNWSSSDQSIVAVSGTGQVGTLTGGSPGTATITAASADTPSATASCTVTVATALWQEVYMGGDYGMAKNTVIEPGYDGCEIMAVFVDHAGAVHATGYYYDDGRGVPVYFRDGARTFLPYTAGTDALGTAVHVTYDGHVYIVGFELDESGRETAKLWTDGVNTPLAGASEYFLVEATGVFADGGNVYVTALQSADGEYYDPCALWVNDAKTNFPALETSLNAVAARGGDVYLGGGFGLVRLNPNTPTEYAVVPGYSSSQSYWGSEVQSLCLAGEDLYASGWVEHDPVVWKNHARAVLPWDSNGYEYAEATGVCVGLDGSTYVSGRGDVPYFWDWWEPLWWKNNQAQALGDLHRTEASPNAIGVREAPVVPVTGVSLPAALSVPIGFTNELTATIAPAAASNTALAWTSSNEAVATITGSGATVTINGLSLGSATITARSLDNPSAAASCTATVQTVAVTGVDLPPALTLPARRNGWLAATLSPATATNTAVSWSSSNAAVATVSGAGLLATVHADTPGSATITVTTADGNRTANCALTVTPAPAYPSMYVVGGFGMYVDGALNPALGEAVLAEVFVDESGHVHAAGCHHDESATPPYQAAYFYDDAQTLLPTTWADAVETDVWGLAVDGGNVYLAGSEARVAGDGYELIAKLWINGEARSLEGAGEVDGAGEMFSSQATTVRVHNGSHYVAGFTQDADHNSVCAIWKDGAKYATNIPGYFQHMVIDTAGNIYCRCYDNVYRVTLGPPVTATPYAFSGPAHVLNIAVDGTDLYAVGWYEQEACYWKNNGARVTLPRPEDSSWAEAHAVHIHDGVTYIAGVLRHGMFYTHLWRAGQEVPPTDPLAIDAAYSESDYAKPWWIFAR